MQIYYVAGLRLFQEGLPLGLVGRRKVWGQPVAHKSLPWHGICSVPLQSWWWEMVRSSLLFMYSQLSRGCALIFTVQINPPLFKRMGKDLRNRVRNSYTLHQGRPSMRRRWGGRVGQNGWQRASLGSSLLPSARLLALMELAIFLFDHEETHPNDGQKD